MFVKYGEVVHFQKDGTVLIAVPLGTEAYKLDRQQIETCEVRFSDGRKISPSQRKFIYSLIWAIADFMAEEKETVKEALKESFRQKMRMKNSFSLSDVTITQANEFLEYLMGIVLDHGIPTKTPLSEMSADVGKYIYGCCIKGRCCIYNQPGQIVNLTHPGEPVQTGDFVLPLCERAVKELRTVGLNEFTRVWHIKPIRADIHLTMNKLLSKRQSN